jgi:hypothetical protein
MHRLGAIANGASGAWKWTSSGEIVGTIAYGVTLDENAGVLTLTYALAGSHVSYAIRLSATKLHYGGRRWYAHCPYSGRRARKLYKFSGIEKFCHRTSVRPLPTYASQRVSGSERVNLQRWSLRRRLGDRISDLFGEPFKPKWMRWKTFQKYLDRDNELAAREEGYFAAHFASLMSRLA